eukprot:5796801-Pyramimonas_sp.AAC.1
MSAERRGHLSDVMRAAAVSAFVNFSRLPQERIVNLAATPDILRNRAQLASQLMIGSERLSFLSPRD